MMACKHFAAARLTFQLTSSSSLYSSSLRLHTQQALLGCYQTHLTKQAAVDQLSKERRLLQMQYGISFHSWCMLTPRGLLLHQHVDREHMQYCADILTTACAACCVVGCGHASHRLDFTEHDRPVDSLIIIFHLIVLLFFILVHGVSVIGVVVQELQRCVKDITHTRPRFMW